jgi:Tfp pilus assembly protein PilF
LQFFIASCKLHSDKTKQSVLGCCHRIKHSEAPGLTVSSVIMKVANKMKCKKLLIIFLTFVLPTLLIAQGASICEKMMPLLTYAFSDPDPVPQTDKIYPYFRFDGYALKGEMRNWKMIEMENDYIKLWVAPEIGGKIWGAVEKSTGKEFIYFNHSVKFRDIAMRGPWTSGGLEINFGVIGHAPTCSSPLDYMIRKNDDGSVSCFVGAIDLSARTRWSVEINLPKDKAWFTTRSTWDNPTTLEQSYYHWMNLGVKSAGNLEYIFPGNHYLGHDGKNFSWPIDAQGHNLAFYEKNNFGPAKSYHVFGQWTDFYGVYWHDDDFGFGHYATYDEKPGKKIWIWGLSDQGMIWEKLLTDTDGQYTEIQSGRLFNQAGESSSNTPFKNRGFAPGCTDEWTEYWFPVKGIRGLKNATPIGSANLEQKGQKVSVMFCPNETTDDNLQVRHGNAVVFSKEIHAKPMQNITQSFPYQGDYKNLSVWFGNDMLCNADPEKYQIKRPVEMPVDFNWETAYGHYVRGKEWERQRSYKSSKNEFVSALAIDPWFAPALIGMANLAFRQTEYDLALDYALKALSIDTYDADANMIYGMAALALADTTSAVDGFSMASAGVSQRVAAYNSLAGIFLKQGNVRKALAFAEKSLLYNQLSTDAVQLKILCLRKAGMPAEAVDGLNKLAQRDPLNHFIRLEKYFSDPSSANKTLVQKSITNELAHETYLEYALWYLQKGQLSDALKILQLAPENHPVVLLWQGYLLHLLGDEPAASAALAKAIQLRPSFVFPFRTETLSALEWAQTLSADWKLKYYAGLIYLGAHADDKAGALWSSLKDEPDFYPFYIARSRLTDATQSQTLADVDKALQLAKTDWRAGLFAVKYYLAHGQLQKSEQVAQSFFHKFPTNYYLGLQYAKVLLRLEKYSDCIGLLKKLQVLPNEGATEGRTIWHNANMAKAMEWIKAEKFRKALENIAQAKLWPANLGVGRPYKVDERLEDFMAFRCYKKLKDEKSILMMQNKIIGNPEQLNLTNDVTDVVTALVLKDAGYQTHGEQIMMELLTKNPSSKNIQWCSRIYSNDWQGAKIIERELGDSDPTMLFLIEEFSK